jgi:phosphopantothenoylcysteine decarboxylase/phosphopantothenate--cysteine ligase
MHPAKELHGTSSKKLENKRIILAITGSIAAINTVQLARELIRHSADVIPVMTPSATKIIHPDAIEFATGHKPITTLTGQTEHVTFCGLVKDPVDLLLISPCTANTISKIIHGIDDTPVTTFATTAIGSHIPIILVPAMHLSMYQHHIIQQNLNQCTKQGIQIISPNITKNKAKMPTTPQIIVEILKTLGPNDLTKQKILIIGGTTSESIDTVRILTTRSSGITALTLAKNAFERNADVTLWYGNINKQAPEHFHQLNYVTYDDLTKLIQKTNLSQYTSIIVCAAIADYTPININGKIPSGKKSLTLSLKPTPKLLKIIKDKTPKTKLIAYKLEHTQEYLEDKTTNLQKTYNLHLAVGNTVETLGKQTNTILTINNQGKTHRYSGTKEQLANIILDTLKE